MIKPYIGDRDERCPHMGGKLCYKVCPSCKFQERLLGVNPQTGETIEKWDCALRLHYLLTIEGNAKTYGVGAAIESFRNEVAKRSDTMMGGAHVIGRAIVSHAERSADPARIGPPIDGS